MKTAEETLREIGNGTISKSVAIKAMERYSEERLKEWKEVLLEIWDESTIVDGENRIMVINKNLYDKINALIERP